MNFFTKKNFLYKLIISLCIVLAVINFLGTKNVYAEGEGSGIGGVLIDPICELLIGLGDAIMNILQNSIMGTDATLVLDNTQTVDLGGILIGLIVVALAVVATVITAGGFAAAVAAITPALVKGALIYGAIAIASGGQSVGVISAVSAEMLSDRVVLPTYTIGPEEIFSGRILLFDANIFNPKTVYVEYDVVNIESEEKTSTNNRTTLEIWNSSLKNNPQNKATRYYYESDGKLDNNPNDDIATSINNSAYELRDVIAKWYYIIRTIALVGSMLILLYVGIRMILSSIAEEKAKYKQMLGDWVIALCLIFLMHYIMIFAHNIVESIINIFDNTADTKANVAVIQEPGESLIESVQKIEEASGEKYYNEEEKLIKWPTNQMGRFRVKAQAKDGTDEYLGYTLAYLALVLFTLAFSFTYIKRLLYLLFLTVIAPLVALTYPIDKIHDGKAQAFDMWLKEYIFNLLIQPFHLLLYTLFVTMAFDLAGTNVIYSLVVLGFMIPAEKFLRTMFGFNKASTPGLLAGAAGAAITMSAISSLGKFASKGGSHGGQGSGGKDNGKDEQGKLRTADSEHSQEKLYGNLATPEDNDNLDTQNDGYEEFQSLMWGNEAEQERLNLQEPISQSAQLNESEDEEDEQHEMTIRDRIANTRPIRFARTTRDSIANSERVQRAKAAYTRVATSKPGRFIRSTAKTGWNITKSELKKLPGGALKIGANVATGATLGAIGLASGIVSGDLNTAVRNTTVGATTGAAISNGVANRFSNSINKNAKIAKDAKEQWQKDYYGEDYNAEMRKKADKEFAKDKQIRELYKQQLSLKNKQEIDDAMRDANKYREYGINDNNIIIKAMKADNGNAQNRAENRRIAAAKLAENSKTEKDLETNMKRFAKVPGMKQKQVQDMERLVRGINNL